MRTTPAWRALAALAGLGVAGALVAAAAPVDFDFVAQGARITGAVGDQAEIKLGFRNDGPAAVDRRADTRQVSVVEVLLPAGTTAVAAPADCRAAGPAKYRCSPGSLVTAGQTITFAFTLRIDAPPTDAGAVRINLPCDCDDDTIDANAGNDTAPIQVVAAAAGGGGGGAEDHGPPTAGLALGAGGLLVLAGLVGAVVAGRRRGRAAD
ncbi:hypothetical protein O7635_10655 [Asanoa sp. WMMD1127]|uniref:hypothetical protein n=1 Tax=Asanoa sp. WMMD1127 TaxID=3016107 RepID=UPI002415FFC8|nr:hypothetical protein [Asanoa sp. WMMD1127]MDG4822311.1 hypothetical protein [Asanoa sp. WMMD1127]